MSVKSRDLVLGLILDGLNGELLLALLGKRSVLGSRTKAPVQGSQLTSFCCSVPVILMVVLVVGLRKFKVIFVI